MDLFHNNMSVCSQKVRLVIREKGLNPIEHHLNLRAGDQTKPEYLRLNPKGVVPTIIDHEQPIIESTVISEYLDDAYPDPPLKPKNPLERAQMRLWTMIPDSGLHGACGVVSFAIAFRHQYLALPRAEMERQLNERPDPASRERVRELIRAGIEARPVPEAIRLYDKVLTEMSRRLDNSSWLAGDQYSLAETSMLPYVLRLEDLSLSWLWQGKRESIARWLERCKSRANFTGIKDYIDPKYLELMGPVGREATPKMKEMLAA